MPSCQIPKYQPRDKRPSSLRKADRQIAAIGPNLLTLLALGALWQLLDWLF